MITPHPDVSQEEALMLAHHASIFAAEAARLTGAPTYTQEDLDARMEALLQRHESPD